MPTHKVKGGYKWGKSGKVYPTKAQANKQGRAIYANGWRGHINETRLNQIIDEVISDIINEIKKRV